MVLQTLEQIGAECDKGRAAGAAAADDVRAAKLESEQGGLRKKLFKSIWGE